MAKIIKFRIRNYKSIVDSGYFYLDERLTVLAGKNESGKTSVLEAIEDFGVDKAIREDAQSIVNEKSFPEIEATLDLSNDEVKALKEKFPIFLGDSSEVVLVKDHENNYFLKKSLFPHLEEENHILMAEYKDKIKDIKTNIKHTSKNEIDLKNETDYLILKDHLLSINAPDEMKNFLISELDKANNLLTENFVDLDKMNMEVIESLKECIPNFILFDTSRDQNIPNEIPFSEIGSNEFAGDLSKVSDLDLDLAANPKKERERTQMEMEVNVDLFKNYKKFWDQDLANIRISWREGKLLFWVVEGGKLYRPSMRSKGKQWHIAFYIKLSARAKEGKVNFLLIDEPGLFLHSKAQKDILRKIKDSSKRMQMIYSTHSPYLIDVNNLDRIRLVEKDNGLGTRISKITAKPKYRDTLAPILTAIGEDQTGGIKTDKNNSVILEGFSDFLWLKAFKILLEKEELNLIPGTGGNSCLHIGSIIFGWGLNPLFVLDNDSQGDLNHNKLRKSLGISDNRIIRIPFTNRGEIEDLFGSKDRANYADYSEKFSKTILAIKFLNKIELGELKISDLEKDTINNFKELFDKLLKAKEDSNL